MKKKMVFAYYHKPYKMYAFAHKINGISCKYSKFIRLCAKIDGNEDYKLIGIQKGVTKKKNLVYKWIYEKIS